MIRRWTDPSTRDRVVSTYLPGPLFLGEEVIDGLLFNEGIGEGIVIEEGGWCSKWLGVVHLAGGGGIDSPCETVDACGVVGLHPRSFRFGGQRQWLCEASGQRRP